MAIEWKPYSELRITPDMENWTILLYVAQEKLCARKLPEVLTGDIIDGKVQICSTHKINEERDWNYSTITHYAWLNDPYD